MNTQSDAVSESAVQSQAAPAVMTPGRLFCWCVRRELWEYRSVYLAPLAIAAVILLGYVFVLVPLPHTMQHAMTLDPAHQREELAQPFDVAAALIMGAAFIVSIFYSIDALYGERRDRSILFWKSLPVSDLTTVLAKASIPLVVMPLVTFAITVATESIMLLLSSVVLLGSGQSVGAFWSRLELYRALFMLLYHLVTAHMLWYAPMYAWLLLISAWARRAPFLWAFLPPFAVGVFEKIAFHTSYFAAFLQERIGGGITAVNHEEHSSAMPMDPGMHLTPGAFLASPGLWLGLVFAAIFLVAAARLRRYRQPN